MDGWPVGNGNERPRTNGRRGRVIALIGSPEMLKLGVGREREWMVILLARVGEVSRLVDRDG